MKKVIKRVLLVAGILLLVFTATMGLYLSHEKNADETAVEAFLHPATGVTAVNENGRMVFTPEEGTDCAVILYPGAKVRYEAYASLAEEIAKNGIMCILADMPLNLALLNTGEAERIKTDYPEMDHWYVGGHSMGGLAAQNCAAAHPGGYDGLIVLAARITVDFSESDMPVLLITATNDGICTPEDLEKEKTPKPKELTHVVIEGGNHGNFGSYREHIFDGDPEISREEQQKQTACAIAEWIKELQR